MGRNLAGIRASPTVVTVVTVPRPLNRARGATYEARCRRHRLAPEPVGQGVDRRTRRPAGSSSPGFDVNREQARPADQLTAADRRQLRQHHADVAVLVEHRDSWSDWHAKPLPVFDPSKAFFTDAEIRGVASG